MMMMTMVQLAAMVGEVRKVTTSLPGRLRGSGESGMIWTMQSLHDGEKERETHMTNQNHLAVDQRIGILTMNRNRLDAGQPRESLTDGAAMIAMTSMMMSPSLVDAATMTGLM